MLYWASRDGFKNSDWSRCCAGAQNTLTLVKVSGSGFLLGAFSPLTRPARLPSDPAMLSDPSGRTCLLSLINAHARPCKLRLRAGAAALWHRECGLTFGAGNDLSLGLCALPNTPKGCSATPSASFELDADCESRAGLAPFAFPYDHTLLAGPDAARGTFAYFAAAEIETWQL